MIDGFEQRADQRLDFAYVEDAARGLVMLYEAKQLRYRIYNIATGEAHTVVKNVISVRLY